MNPDTLDAIAPLAEPVVPKRIPSPDAALRLSSLSPRRVNAAAIPEAPVPAGVPTDAAFERDYGNSWKPKAVREAAAAPTIRTPEMEADFQRSKAIPAPIKPDAKFSTFDEWVDKTYGIAPVVRYGMDTGRRANKPTMGTEIGSRRPELGFGSPVVERDGKLVDWQPPTGFASKSWQALRNGLVTTQDSLNGMVGIGAGLLGAKSMVERTADYARWVTEDMALNEVKGDNWFTQGYYDALGAAPNMALQIALAAATKSPAGFIIGGAGTAAGGQFNESVNAYRDAGQSMEDATANALVDSAISGAVTGVTNILPGKVLMGGKAKAAIANAVGMARLKQIGLMGLKGAGAEAAQEFSEQAGTDFLVALRRLNKPEFDQFYAENPKWASDILSGALRSAVAGAMLGGAAGASVSTAQMTADKYFRPDTKGLRGAADAVAMTPEQADAAAAALSATAEKVDAATKDDADFQRKVAPALDLTGFTDDQLADIVLKGNSGETAPLNGGLLPDRPFTVNPIIAGEELKRRKSGGPVKAAGGGLKINEDGSTSPGAVAAWTARNPALSAEMRAKDGLSRADLDRIVGRKFGANSMLVRQRLLKEIAATEPDGVSAAREVVEELTGLPPERAALVARGLSPKTAAQEPVVKYADPMAADIAALNGVDPETIEVREANTDAERRAAKFGESRGITVRFFDSKEGVATRGASRGASMYLNSGLSSENQLVSVAVHEALDLLHSGDPDGWRRMFGVVEDKAPKALDALRRAYESKAEQQAEDAGTDAALGAGDIEREGMSNLAEALVRAFDLHLAVDGKGGFDKAKARELVGYDPSFFARLVDAVRRALGAVGIRLKGMNKGQADRIAQFMGREPHELSSPAVRGFIADQLGNALNAIHVEGGAKASQSIGDAPLGGRSAKVDRDEFLARRYNPTASLGRFADVLYRETSIERAFELIDRNADGQDLSRTEFFMAESPEMALGQGENRGVMIAFDAAPLNGQVNRGKALAEQAFRRGDGEFVALGNSRETYRDAVRSVTVKKGATGQPWMVRRMKVVLDKFAKDGWTKTANADGSETYSRPDAVRGVSQSLGDSRRKQTDTPEFKRWFGKSKVVDEGGKPMPVSHQTHNDFTVFDRLHMAERRSKIPGNVDSVGLWFTDDKNDMMYGPKNIRAYLAISNPAVFVDDTASGVDPAAIMSEGERAAFDDLLSRVVERGTRSLSADDLALYRRLDAKSESAAKARVRPRPKTAFAKLQEAVSLAGGIEEYRASLRASGNDGILLQDTRTDKGNDPAGETHNVWIALEPTQIKSATGNNGNFDSNNPDITQSIGESNKPKRDREALSLAREAKERAAAARTANTNKVWSNLRARINAVQRRGEQSRIDLAHRIGRREGLMSGEVEGQRKGRREGAKATKAEYRQLLSDAEQAIAVLPVPWQGKFRSRLSKATTKTRVLRLAEKVAEALAMSTVQDARKRAFAQQKRLRKRGMKAETKALVESLNAEAIELLSGEGGRITPYTSMADLASRVATASEAMAEARALADADRASFKAAKADRAVANKAAAAALVESLKAVPSTEEPTDITKARKMGVMGRVWRQNADMHTVVERIEGVSGGALTDAWSALESGENAKTQAVASVKERWDDRIKRLGFKDREDFDRRAQGGYGEASAIMLPVRLGGREVRIPLGKAMALAAIDKSTEARIVKAGFSWKDDPDAAAIIPTTHELNILRRRLGSKNMAMVEGVKNDLAAAMEDQYFAAHHRLNGKTAKKEEGYFPTVRHGDPNPDEMPLDASPSKIASGMFRQQTNQIERVNSDRKFLFGDFMQTMERQADDMARFIHQAEATRRAVTLLTDKRVADELKRAFGSDMKERLVEHVLHGVGLGKHTQLSSADKAISSISGNFLLLNYETWLRQLGGIARAGTEMPAGALAVGAAQAAALNGSPKARAELVRKVMRANGFALARWTQSMVGVQTGFEGGAKADKARFVAAMKAVGDSMREAVGDARSLQLRQAAKRVGSAGWNAARMLRSMESALRFVDQQVFLSAMLGHAHAIKAANPSIGEDALFQQAVRMAERTFRRTQNSSSRLDDTLMQSRAKQRQSAARLMFPFSTDTLKAWNQLSRAYRSGSKRDMARAASAVAVNNLWSAAINPAIGLGALAVGLALTDGQDDETLTQQAMDDAAVKFGRKAATDALGPVAGYAGIVSSYIADAALRSRNPDVGDNIIPIRVMNDLGAGVVDLVKTGDPVPVAKAAAMTLTPVGVPVAKAATLHAQATPGIEEVAKALRKRQAANDLTLAQHRRLQQVEAQIERERAERIKAGTQTAKDREWMAEQKAAKEGKARQAEKFRTEAEKLRSGK